MLSIVNTDAVVVVPVTTRFELGVVLPIPTFPEAARNRLEVAVTVLVPEKYGNCPVVPE